MNQSTDSGHSNQSGATNEVLRPVLSRACRYGTIVFPRLAAGLFSRAWRLDCFPALGGWIVFPREMHLTRLVWTVVCLGWQRTKDSFLLIHRQMLVCLFRYSTYLWKITLQFRKEWSNPLVVWIKWVLILKPVHTIFGGEKKLADPFSFASGSQDVTKSNLNQAKRLLN